jgi:SAM-dependent methyltransferase
MNLMPTGLWITLGVAALLFAAKAIYGLSIALVLPITRGALYVSTARQRVAACLAAVDPKPGQLMIDLGCGDGRVLRAAHRQYKLRVEGYELNPLAYLKASVLSLGCAAITIRCQDFWKADLSGADVVFCYLFPDVMVPLARKLKAELKPGATIVSCNFPLPGFHPERVFRPGGRLIDDPVFIYRIPDMNAEGEQGCVKASSRHQDLRNHHP